jgi:peptidyl-prolyl cis-trans isomerase SurA
MILRNTIIILLSVTLLLSSSPAQGELLDRIVAVVNNDIITLSDLDEMYLPYANRIRADGYDPEQEKEFLFEARKEILNRFIEQKLADQEISAKKVRVSDDEVDNALERVKNENSCTEEELVKLLARDGYTLEQYKERLREQSLHAKLVNSEVKSKIVITENEIRDYYNKHKEIYKGKNRYYLRSILLKISPSDNEEHVLSVIKKGEGILKRIGEGLSFEDAAKEFSEAASAASGGDLGCFFLEELTPALKEALQELQPGGISPVLRTPAGIQIIKLVKKEEISGKSLEKAKAEIHQKLFQSVVDTKYKEWVQGLRERAYIKIML